MEMEHDQGKFLVPAGNSVAECWGLYGQAPIKGLVQIGKFATRQRAEAIYYQITGKRY
jgi:hypothetical protein